MRKVCVFEAKLKRGHGNAGSGVQLDSRGANVLCRGAT